MRIDLARLQADLEALGSIGATPEGGVSRPSLADLKRYRFRDVDLVTLSRNALFP